MTAKFKVFNF